MERTRYAYATAIASLLLLVGAWGIQSLVGRSHGEAVPAPPTRPSARQVYKVAMQSTPADTATPGPTAGIWPLPTFGIEADPTEYPSYHSLSAIATAAASPNATAVLTHTRLALSPIGLVGARCCGLMESRQQILTTTDLTNILDEYTGTFEVQGWFYTSDTTWGWPSYWLVLTGLDSEVAIPTAIGTYTPIPTPTGTVMAPREMARVPRVPQVQNPPTAMPMNVVAWHVKPITSSVSGGSLIQEWSYGWSYYDMLEWLRVRSPGPYYGWRP